MGYLPAAGLPAPGQNAGTPPGRLTTGPTHSTIRQRRPQAPGRNEWLKVPHLRALTSGIHPPLMGSSGWYTVYLPQSPSGACIPGGRGHCLSIYRITTGPRGDAPGWAPPEASGHPPEVRSPPLRYSAVAAIRVIAPRPFLNVWMGGAHATSACHAPPAPHASGLDGREL